jgi:hypothetical protein
MKTRTLIILLATAVTMITAFPNVSAAQSDRRDDRYDRGDDRRDDDRRDNLWGRGRSQVSDRRDLEGTWYLNGDSDKRAEIHASRDGLEARNEQGQTSRLEVGRNGDVRALDWERGMRGDVRRDRIEWENGTTWTREARDRRR